MILPLPHGVASIVVALISSSAAILSVISLSTCKFAFRSILTSENSNHDGIYIGIWGWGIGDDLKITSTDNCFQYSNPAPLDVFVSTARGLGIIPVTFGVIASIICWSSICLNLSKTTLVVTGLGFIVTCICESSKFFIFASEVCIDIDSNAITANLQVSDCSMDDGSFMCVAASACWLICALILATIAISSKRDRIG